jgi:glycosyltransferase involved in cell wall biosynthesis
VHFLGERADPLSVLRGARAFVLPSWAESFPYVVLEAMSVGLPIVATDVGGVAEALTDGEHGLLVPPRDDRALAGALIALLDDPVRAARLASAAKERVERRFSRTEMIDGLLGVYGEALLGRPRA